MVEKKIGHDFKNCGSKKNIIGKHKEAVYVKSWDHFCWEVQNIFGLEFEKPSNERRPWEEFLFFRHVIG